MTTKHTRTNRRAFTLVEMLIVITLIALLAALTMGGYTYAMRSSKRRVTTGTFEAIKLALDRYNTEFGEYPEPAGNGMTAQFPPGSPGLTYDISGAACLYQAITGDGFDQIKGVTSPTGADSSSAASDGKTEGAAEVKNRMMVEPPQTMWMRKNTNFILIDGFAHPFQYIKAAPASPATGAGGSTPTETTINAASYDLWSYAEDEVNTTKTSIDTVKDPSVSVKWIKNW